MKLVDVSAMCSTKGGSQGNVHYICFHNVNKAEEMSPEIQNRGTSGPKIGHVNVSDNKKL